MIYLRGLIESPMSFRDLDPNHMDYILYNKEITDQIKTGNPISAYNYLGIKWNLYESDKKYYIIVAENNNKTSVMFIVENLPDNGIQFKYVWSEAGIPGIAREAVFTFFLNNFKYIQSDWSHTQNGIKYWKRF